MNSYFNLKKECQLKDLKVLEENTKLNFNKIGASFKKVALYLNKNSIKSVIVLSTLKNKVNSKIIEMYKYSPNTQFLFKDGFVTIVSIIPTLDVSAWVTAHNMALRGAY